MKPTKFRFCWCLAFSLVTATHAADKLWFGGSGDWSNGANWIPTGVPSDTDNVVISNGTVQVTAAVNIASLGLSGGTVSGSNTVVVTNGTWTGGTMAGTGATLIPAGGHWQISGSATKQLTDRMLVNAGTVVWSGGEIDLHNAAVISNLVAGTFDVAFDGTLAKDPFGGFTVHNAGLWRKSAGTALLADFFDNSGTVAVQQGTLHFANGYTQAGGGVLKCELGGTIPGTQYGQVAVSGAATLDGSLQASFINGFVPATGDFFVVMTHPAWSGSFASNNAATLGLTTHYNPTNLVLIAGTNAFPAVTLTVANGSTQTVCQPFTLQASAMDVDGYVTNLAILQDGLPLAGASSSSFSTLVEVDFPRIYSFTTLAQDDKGGTTSVTQPVTVVACPLYVLNLGGFRSNGAFKICMLGTTGSNYQVLASPDLNSTNWTTIGVMESTNGIWRYFDYDATNHASRYYQSLQKY